MIRAYQFACRVLAVGGPARSNVRNVNPTQIVLAMLLPLVVLASVTLSAPRERPESPENQTKARSSLPSNRKSRGLSRAHFEKQLGSPRETTRRRALNTLTKKFAGAAEIPALLVGAVDKAIEQETVSDSTYQMIRMLGGAEASETVDAAVARWVGAPVDALPAPRTSLEAMWVVLQRNHLDPDLHDHLISLLDAQDFRVVMLAVDILSKHQSSAAFETIAQLVNRPVYRTRYGFRHCLLSAMAQYNTPAAIDVLVGQMLMIDGQLKYSVVDFLTSVSGQPFGANSLQWVAWWKATRENSRPDKGSLANHNKNYPWDYPLPLFYQNKIYGKKVVFVIDISGTMSHRVPSGQTRLDVAKLELNNAIRALPPDSYFNIVTFQRQFQVWSPNLMPATLRSKQIASHRIMRLKASSGTAFYDGVDAGLSLENTEVVYVLSDGLPTAGRITDPGEIAQAIAATNLFRRVTINTVSVGRESDLMAALATQSKGHYRVTH